MSLPNQWIPVIGRRTTTSLYFTATRTLCPIPLQVEVLKDTSALTRLVPDLTGVHPDDSFSRVPYEKGSLFLRYLEDLTGGPGKNFIFYELNFRF